MNQEDAVTAKSAVGVDGCRAGWVLATRASINVRSRLDLRELPRELGVSIVGVDMPIGLADTGARDPEMSARRFLGRRSATVFSAPARPALAATSHRAASDAQRAASGAGMSIQAFHLMPKIRELDSQLPTQTRVIEVHPECSFVMMSLVERDVWPAPDRPGIALPPKRSEQGRAERLRLLRTVAEISDIPDRLPGASADDIVDACAVLWSTERWLAGDAHVLGSGTLDRKGTPMRIVC